MKSTIFRILISEIIVIIHYLGAVSSFGLFDLGNFSGSQDPSSEPSNDVFDPSSLVYTDDEESSSSSFTRNSYINTEPAITICRRVPRSVSIGRDVTGTEHQIDVGECRHLTIPAGYFQPEVSSEICDVSSPCESNRNRTEMNSLLGGDARYDVIEECACRKIHQGCGRRTLFKTFFPNSPHETTLDVGSCSGRCEKENCDGCFPTRRVTTSIQGPNGDECVEKVIECSCTKNCHRESWLETYYVQTWDPTLNETVTTKKTFDVGKCTGSCAPRPFCLFRDPISGKCTSSLNTPTTCSRTSFTTHTFTTPDGNEKILLTSDDCVCV